MSCNWKLKKLSALISVKHGFAFKGKNFRDHKTSYVAVTPGNFNIGGGFKNDKLRYFEGEVDQQYILNPNDLIVSMTDLSKKTDTLGYPAKIPTTPSLTYLHNQRIGLIQKTKESINLDFLYYLMCSNKYRHHIVSTSTGSTVKHTAPGRIENFEFFCPPSSIQKKIGTLLKSFDDKIELNNKINQTLEEMAQAIFKSWFVDFDPVYAKKEAKAEGKNKDEINHAAMAVIASKSIEEIKKLKISDPKTYESLHKTASLFPDSFVDSEIGMIPKGWEVKPLDSIAEYHNGLALQKFRPEDEEDYLPIVKIAQLRTGEATHEEKASTNIRETSIINNGDIVFSWSGSLIVDFWCGGKAALNQHLFKVTSSNYPQWFYFYYTKHHLSTFIHKAASIAVTLGHIKRSDLKNAHCTIPTKHFFKYEHISTLLKIQMKNKLQNQTLAELRDTLLPKLLSGEIDLSDIDIS